MTALWAGQTVPDELWNAIIGGAWGSAWHMQIPPALLVSIAWHETGFSNIQSTNYGPPNTPGYGPDGRELSFGPWQLNQDGVGAGYTAVQLLDIPTSRFLAVNYILRQINASGTLRDAIVAWSTAELAWTDYLAYPIVTIVGF